MYTHVYTKMQRHTMRAHTHKQKNTQTHYRPCASLQAFFFLNELLSLLQKVENKNSNQTWILKLTLENNNYYALLGGARGVMVITVGNGLGDTSSNPG